MAIPSDNSAESDGTIRVDTKRELLDDIEVTIDQSTSNRASNGDRMRPGQFGDYLLESEIARGGMGVVFKARQVSLNRIVAIKMILSGQLASSDDVKRFYVEAEAAARLEHPNIVPIYEIGEKEGQHFFSMGYVEGGSLDRLLADKVLTAEAAVKLLVPVVDAIHYAHERGIVHRDLKPANILLTKGGKVSTSSSTNALSRSSIGKSNSGTLTQDEEWIPKVSDFGLAKHLGGDSDLTGTGQILGTPGYMPPEQASGQIKEIGPKSDVYSLGAILYRVLAGRPPFQAATAVETIMQVMKQDPIPVRQLNPSIPVDLETICMKCLQKEPARRYETAEMLAADLRRWLAGDPILARPSTAYERGMRWIRRNPALSSSMAVGLVAIVVVFAILKNSNAKLTEQRDIAVKSEKETQRQKVVAEKRLTHAIEAINRMTSRAASNDWAMNPAMQEERKLLFENAVQFYDSLIADADDTKEVRWEAVKALEQSAGALFILNDLNASAKKSEEAIAICDKLIAEEPNNAEYISRKARLLFMQGSVRSLDAGSVIGSRSTALDSLEESCNLARRAMEIEPSKNSYVSQTVESLTYFAFFSLSGAPETKIGGKNVLPEMSELAKRIDLSDSSPMEDRLAVAFANYVIASYDMSEGKITKAVEEYQKALKIIRSLEDVPAPDPRRADHFMHIRSNVLINLGLSSFIGNVGDPTSALKLMDEGIEQLKTLVRIHPAAFVYKIHLMQAYRSKSSAYTRLGDSDLAVEMNNSANEVLQELIRDNPNQTWLRQLGIAQESVRFVERVRTGDLSKLDETALILEKSMRTVDTQAVLYNIACAYSVAISHVPDAEKEKYRSKAFLYLNRLKELQAFKDPKQVELAKSDSDMANVRGSKEWNALFD